MASIGITGYYRLLIEPTEGGNVQTLKTLITPPEWLVGGGGGGGNGSNFRTGVRASISKPTPIIYLSFEKTDPFIY